MSDYFEIQTVVNPYYLLNDGKVYDKDKKDFVTKDTDTDYKEFLEQGNQPLSINDTGYTREQLIETVLNVYHFEVGECLLNFEELKQKRLSQIEKIASSFEQNPNKEMYFTSSLGFRCNGDRRTETNINGLINYFDAISQDGVVVYKDFDNKTQNLNKSQLETLLQEHTLNGFALYNQKWDLVKKVNETKELEELKKIEIKFIMQDFSSKP